MLISTFNALLSKANPGASAYIPNGSDWKNAKVSRKSASVCVQYAPNGKTYEYKGSILRVAERLDLIPSTNHDDWSRAIIERVCDSEYGSEVFAPIEVIDTVRHVYSDSKYYIQCTEAGKDQYGRKMGWFYRDLRSNDPWLSGYVA